MQRSQGDEAQDRFRAVFDAHYGAVLAYARRRSADDDEAQDAAAETFTVAWRRLEDLPAAEGVRPWLYGVTRKVMANQRRGSVRRAHLTARLSGHVAPSVELGDRLDVEEERATVLAALGRLKEADQELLRLVAWEELSHREIAQVLGCSEGSVAVRLHRARNRLGKEIAKGDRRGGQVPPHDPTAP